MTDKELAHKAWCGAAKIYGTMIGQKQVDHLFEMWWKRNSEVGRVSKIVNG